MTSWYIRKRGKIVSKLFRNKLFLKLIDTANKFRVRFINPGVAAPTGPYPPRITNTEAVSEMSKWLLFNHNKWMMRPSIIAVPKLECYFCSRPTVFFKLIGRRRKFFGVYRPCDGKNIMTISNINGSPKLICTHCKPLLNATKTYHRQITKGELIISVDLDKEYDNIIHGRSKIEGVYKWKTLFSKAFKSKGRTCISCGDKARLLVRSKSLGWRVYNKDTTKFFTVDHTIPKCKGGQDTTDNLEIMCNQCNTRKGHADHVPKIPKIPIPDSI